MSITQPTPWIIGQVLTHTNGMTFVATGTSAYKMSAPEVVIEPEDPPKQEIFCAGETLPSWMQNKVQVCYKDNTTGMLCDDDIIPANIDGTIFVDETTGKAAFNQNPVKQASKILINSYTQPTDDNVADGVLLWCNLTDGCFYTLKDDGTWFSSDKGDTNTNTTLFQAPAAGVDDIGGSFGASDWLFLLADDTIVCAEKPDEIGPSVTVNPSDATTLPANSGAWEKQCLLDTAGNLVGVVDSTGSHLIDDDDDELGPTVEVDITDSTTLPTDSGDWKKQCLVDSAGNMVGFVDSTGVHLIEHNKEVITSTTSAASTDAWGFIIPAGSQIIELSNGKKICIPKDVVTGARCVNRNLVFDNKDGTENCVAIAVANYTEQITNAAAGSTDENTAVGVIGDEWCRTAVSYCGVQQKFEISHSYSIDQYGSGFIQFRMQCSIDDGATWQNTFVGGSSFVSAESDGIRLGEVVFYDWCYGPCNSNNKLCIRNTVSANDLSDGAVVNVNHQSIDMQYTYFAHK